MQTCLHSSITSSHSAEFSSTSTHAFNASKQALAQRMPAVSRHMQYPSSTQALHALHGRSMSATHPSIFQGQGCYKTSLAPGKLVNLSGNLCLSRPDFQNSCTLSLTGGFHDIPCTAGAGGCWSPSGLHTYQICLNCQQLNGVIA